MKDQKEYREMALTDSKIKAFRGSQKARKETDMEGLYLWVTKTGNKTWRRDFALHGKRGTFSIGSYPEVSLSEAREKNREAKRLIKEGINPTKRRQMDLEEKAVTAKNTFQVVADEWFKIQSSTWTPGHARTVKGRLEKNILPWLGSFPIEEITPRQIKKTLKKIENRGAIETAHRCRSICSQIFQYAIADDRAESDPSRDLAKVLRKAKAKAMSAITDQKEVGGLMRAIDNYQGDEKTRIALQLAALTFVRPGELRHWEWKEVNWIKREWLIPAEKMKMKYDHIVPLSLQAFKYLQEIHSLTGKGKYVFPSVRTGERPMSNNTVLAALRRMGYTKEEMSGHGFRAMASTLMNDLEWDSDLIELQLSHVQGKVRAAYNRAAKLKPRKKLMQDYADLLDRLRDGRVAEVVAR